MPYGSSFRSLSSVKVNRAEILERIRKNLENHIQEYEQALEDWRVSVVKQLKVSLKEANKGTDINLKVYRNLPKPENHQKQYEIAIDMLEMSLDDELELDKDEFRKYIRDEWEWKEEFRRMSDTYANSSGRY